MNHAHTFSGHGLSNSMNREGAFVFSDYVAKTLHHELAGLKEFNIIRFFSVCGFVSAVLSQTTGHKPPSRLEQHLTEITKKKAVLVIAYKNPDTIQKKLKSKKVANRKHISMNSTYRGYKVNAKKSGCFTQMLKRSIDLIEATQSKYKRTLMIRFDLKQHSYTESSERVSKLFKNLTRWIKKYYRTDYVGFMWARENENVKNQHYHCFVLMDGDKARNASTVLEKVIDFWCDPRGGYDVHHNKKGMYKMLNTPEKLADGIDWGSYLAKGRGKGYRPAQSKDYGSSRLPINISTTKET